MDSCIFNLGGKPNTLKNKVLNKIRQKYSLNSIEFTNVAQTVFMSNIDDDFDPGFKTWLSRQNLGIKAEYSDSMSEEDANKLFKAIMLYNNKIHPDVNFDENTFDSDNSKRYKYTSYVARNIAFNALTDMICNREFEAYSADPNHDTSNNYNHYKKVIIESIRNNTKNNLMKSGVTADELKAVLTDVVKNNNNTLDDKAFITCFEILNNKYPSVYVTNLIACYKELTEADDPLADKLTYRNREKAFKQIFSNPKVNTFIYEKEVKEENTDSEDIPESENTVDEATDDAIDMMMKSHTTVENKDFMDDIDADLVLIFNSLPKLVNASYTKDDKGNKNYEKVRDESIGFIKRTNAREVVQIIKQVGNFKNKQSFIESIRKRANNTNEYAFLAVLADMIEKDDDLFNKIMHCVSMSVISKMEVVVDGDTSETKRSNPKADATSTMIYDLLSTAKYSVIDADLVELNFLTSELNRRFNRESKNIDSTIKVNYAPTYAKEFYKILNKIYPNIQEIAIKDYLLFADNNFNKTVDSMFSVVNKALTQAKKMQENHINQINNFVEINKTNNELRQRAEAGEFIAKNLYKDVNSAFEGDIITREFKNNTISLAKMLLPYSSVKLELISKNVEGNNVSDVDNASMLTYLNNIFNDEELLNNYAEVIFKNSQYIKSNYLLEQRDDKGNLINAGVFKYDNTTGKYKATSYAKKMFKASKVAGASYIDNGSNVLYNAMADFDYIVSSYIAFQKCIDTDTNEETKKLANYFIRIPSDAQNSYFITAPRYDTRDLLGTAEESEEFKNAYSQAIIEAKLDESADIANAVNLKTNNDKFNDIVTGKIDSINLYDKSIQQNYGGKNIKIQLINKEGVKYIVTGDVVNINNTNSYAITNINRLGTYFDSKTTTSIENLNKLKNIIKKDLISTGSFTTVNRNSKIFTQFRNVFEQELINMAMNIDAIFKTDKGEKEGMVQMIDRDVFDYNDNFLNDDRELKFYEVYHKRTNKYKLKDGTTATHKTLVQPIYNKVTDENGKEYYEIATDENGYTKYKLSGRCFESDRFTVYTDEGYRNFGQEVIDNYFDLLGANNFLGYTKDADGKIVLKLSDTQKQAIDNAIEEFIKALVKSNRDRLINPLKYAKNTNNSFDSIVNYSINYQLMYYNFCDILEGDSKFYKDSQTFLKRAKEMIAGGKPYGIFDLNRFEENAPEDIDDAKLSNTEFVKIDSEGNKTPYSIKARTGFYGVTITNSIKTSENATKDNSDDNSLFKKLKDDYEKLGFSPEDARINANKILDLYQDTKVNDAQSYITFEEFVRRIAAKGQLNRYKPLIDKILDESTPINPDELKEFVQLQKNFYYDLHYDELFNLRRPRQIKNAEFVLIPRFIKGTDLENVYNIMTKFGIDQLNTSETSKAGKNYILDIFDNEGALLSDVKEDLINNTNNSKFFKHAPFAREIYSYNFLYCQLETPQHIKNSLNKFAIQIAKKVFDNINDKNEKLYPIKQRFFKLYGEKIERCANKVFRELNILDENNLIKLNEYGRLDGLNYEVLLDKFEAELFRTGFDENLLDYVTISESTKLSEVLGAYPKTVMPMSTNIVAPKLESVSQSIMNNSVTRQKIRGYHGGQVTSVGFGNSKAAWELDITNLKKSPSFNEFISKNPNLKSKTQEQRDAYIDNNINKVREDYRKYLTKNNKNLALYSDRLKYHPNGENYVEVLVPRTAVNVNWFDDKGNKKSDEAVLKEIQEAGVDEHIIYRIPTEGKGSICVAKIKGFIDESLGSTIVVPDDWVSQTGSDFDIDSVYSICYKTYIDKITNTIKKVDYKDDKDINENDWYKYINRELKKLEEDIIPNTLHDDIKTEIEDRKKKVDELSSNYSEYNENLNNAFLKCSKPIRGLIINTSKRTAIGTSKRENLIARLTNITNSLKTNVINKKVKGFEDAINYVEAAQKMIDYLNDSPNIKNEYYENTNSAIIELKAENYDKFDSAAQKYNLASYEEFKNNYYKYASEDAIENGITSCIINIMKDDSVRIENLSPSNFKAIIDARDELMNKVVKEKRNARSPFNILDQAEYHGDAISGMSLKALSVVRDNFCSICNTVEPKLTPSNQVKVFYSKDRYNIDSIVRNFSDENGTNIEVTDKGVYVTHDRLGWSNNSLNIENMIFTSYSAQTTAHILDNIKEGNIPNVNIYTFQVYKTFPDLGIDYRTCISFMMHPAVEDIVNFYNINNSVFNDSRFNRPIYDTYIKLANEINRYSIENKANLPVIQVNNIKQDKLKDSIEAALVALGKSYDEIRTQKEVFSVEKNLAGVNNEFDDDADYFVNYYSTIHQFERLYNTSNKINALTRVLNPDKFGAKKSIFETNQVFESINEIINSEDEPVLTVDGANILEAIYPGIERGYSTEQMINKFLTSDKRDSKYPPLYYFLKYATAPSIKISQAIFPTQSIEFREVVNTLNDILPASARISYKLNNNFERYITNCIYRNCKISKSNFIVLGENNDFDISYDITSEPTSTQQQNNLPGPETKINIYAGTNENADLSNFAKRPFVLTSALADRLEKLVGFPVFADAYYSDESEEVKNKNTYNSVEQAFQIAKIAFAFDGTDEAIDNATAAKIEHSIKESTPSEAKRLGRTIPMSKIAISNWDKFSSQIMKEVIKASFEQNPQSLQRLLATGNATLTHTQDKGKWGTEFPKLLMEVRNELRGREQKAIQQSVSNSRENIIVDVIAAEEQRIYGFNRPNSVAIQKEDVDDKGETKRFISPFEISDINNPTNEELNDYVKLTPAQKIAWIKSYFTNPGVFDVFEVNLKNSYKTKYNSINSQLIYFNDSTTDVQSVRNELYKLSKSSNSFIKLAVLDLVKYAFVVEGFTMRKNGVSKAISNKILTDNEMLYNENSIIDDFNSSFDNIVSYYGQSKDIAESFLRGSYNDIPSVPKRSVPKVSSVTKFQDISSMNTELKNILENTDIQKRILNAYNMSHPKSVKKSFNELTDEDKLKTLGYTHQLLFGTNRDVFVDSRDETIIEKYNLDTAPYIVLTVDKKQLLYKVNMLSNGDYYLYPLNKLEKNENNKFSINPDNNTRNVLSKEYYELKKEALDCNGPLPEINNSYIYQKPEPIINSKSVTYEDIKNDESKNETWNTIVEKFEDNKSTYIENYDNEKMQKSPFRVNSKIIPKAYYFMNNSMHFGRINIIDDGRNKYKVIKINAKTFKNSVIDAKDEFDKQVIDYEKNTGKVTGTFKKFLRSYNPSYEQLVYNDFVMFPNTPQVYCMTDYSSETSSNSAIGEDTSIIEGVKRNAKAIYDSIIGNSPVERNNKYTLTDYFTDAYLQMVNNSREKNDEIATEIKNELNSHGIIGQATAINKNLLIASEYTATYAVRRFEDFVDRINHFELIDDTFVPATDPRIMDMCKNDSKLRNKVLKLIEDADSFIESFEVPACLKSEDAEVNNYLNEIKECVNGLKNNEDIDKIKSNFIDIYLSRLSNNPLVKLGLINLTDGLYSTSKAEALFHDVKENSNPLIQVILKDVMDDIYKAEMIGKQDANTFDKRFTAIFNKGVNFDNFITEDGHFKHKYDNKLVEDRKALKDAMLDTRIKYGKNSKQDIQAKLDYYKFMYENFEQALPDDFYKTRIDAIQKIVDSNVFDVYKEYLDILDEINEINEHYDNGTLPDEYKAKKKRLFAKIEELVSPVIETPNGDVLPKFKYNDVEYTLYDKDSKEKLIYSFEAYKELTELIAKIKSNNENYYKYETKRDFDKKLAHYLSIKEKKEVLDDNGFRILSDEELAQDKEYIEAIEWINKNTIKNIRPEIKDLLNKCYSVFKKDKKDTVNIYSAVKAIAKKKGAIDVNGVINGRELSPAVVESLKRLQLNSKVFSDMNAVTGEGLISTIPRNIVIYNDKYKELFGKVSTLTSSTRAVMNNINAILRPHYNYRTNTVDFAALTGKEIIQLSADYEKLYYSKQKDKENKRTMTSEQYKKFKKYFSRNDNNGYVNSAKSTFVNIANLEETKYVEEKLKEFTGDKDGDAFKAYEVKVKNDAREYANKIMNAAETILYETIYYRTKEGISEERIPNRYLFDSLSLTDEGRKELVDVEKTNALQIINRYVKTKPTKYWYQTKEEMIEKYGIDSAEYKQWYDRNTILNIRTHKIEPIAIWMQQEINNAGLSEEIKDIAGKYLTKEQLEELEKQIDEDNKYKDYAPSIYMQNRKLDKSNKKYIQNGTYDDNIKSTSKYRISNNMSEADKEMYDLMKEYINKYAYSDSAKKHFDKGFLPLEIKNDEDLSWGYIGREIANTVGFIPSTKGDNEFQKVISYSNHKDMAMPMTEILKAPGMKQVKTKKPIISDFSSEQEYLVKLKEYNDEVAAVNAHNKEITKNVINRDWKSVFKNFIVEGAHYNAVNNNKYMLFFGLDTLRNQDYLVQNTGWKGLKPLKNKSTEDRDVYETKKDNFVTQQYETITRRLLYEQYKEANKRYTQFANVLQQIQSSKFMMFNVTGGIANVTVGTIGILGEALGKEFFDAKEFAQGARIYDSHILNYLANMYSDKSDCLEDAILKFFYIIDFDNIKGTIHMPDNLNTVFSKLRELGYGMQTGGEHMMQSSALFTILTNHRLFKDEDGHYVAKSLTDAKKDLRYSVLKEILSDEKLKQFTEFINYNTRNLNAKKDYAHFRYDLATDFLMYKCNNEEKEAFRKALKLKEKEITDEFNDDNLHPTIFSQLALTAEGTMGFAKDSILDKLTDDERYKILGNIKNKTISINNKIHGVYDKLGAATIEQHWLGGVLMQYHKHLPMGILKRYRRQGYFNEFRGTVEKGMYNSIIDFLKMNHRELKHKAEDNGYNENQIVAIRSIKQILKNYTTMIGNFRLYYDLMPEYDRANMQRALAGACGVLSALFLTIAMKYVSDLDDEDYKEDDNWFLHRVSALCIYEADRLASESWMYSPIGMINEGKKLWNSPTAANSTLEDMWKGIKLMGEIINPFTDFEPVYKGGPNSGENKFKVIAERQIPIYRNVKRLIDLPKNNHYFKLDTNIIGMVPDEWVKPEK